MTRLVISILSFLLLAFFSLMPIFAAEDEKKPADSIHQAVVVGDANQVQQLLSKGVDINSRNRMGWSLLQTAIQNRQQAIIELLIAKGADVNAKDNNAQTPLHVAVSTEQKDVVELLISKGADVNVIDIRGDNALSLAKKGNYTEITDLLLKHGAKEPSLEDIMGDRYGNEERLYPGSQSERIPQRQTGTISPIVQAPVELDILADPNEIKARIKTFADLEKALDEVAGKSKNEMFQWQQKKYDNRTTLVRTVQKQFDEEIGFIRKVAVEENAKKTTEAIDNLVSRRNGRFKMVSRELLDQKIALKQTQSSVTRSRSRTSARGTRGQYPQRGQPLEGDITEPYAERDDAMVRMNRPEGTGRPPEQLDRETENEISQWLQADTENRADSAKAVHDQILVEISSIRKLAVEEEAKKTTAAIDGLLLHRQERFKEFIKKMEEEKKTLQQTQDQRLGSRYSDPSQRYPQSSRYRGQTSRGGVAEQDQYQQQGTQPRTRTRRR